MSHFDDLLDEIRDDLGLTKAHTLASPTARAARPTSTPNDGEVDPADRPLLKAVRERDDAFVNMFRQMAAVIQAQGRAINDLRARAGIGDPSMSKALTPVGGKITGEEFMAKALSAQAAGKLTGLQVSIAETHINAGKLPPAEIVRAVMSGD